jgi:membrane protein
MKALNSKAIFGLLKQTFAEWNEDRAPRLGAALAYYTVFSLAPLLIIVIAIAGLAFGRQAAEGSIVTQIRGLVGDQGAQMIQTMIQNASKPSSGIIATIIGVVTLLFGALGVFGALQDALNTIWEVTLKPNRGILGLIKNRLLSLTMVLGTGFLLLVSLVISAVLAGLSGYLDSLFPGASTILEIVNLVISFLVVVLLFALIFKILPDADIAWRDVWIGAFITALLFVIGRFALSFYLGRAASTSTYGAAGSLVILLLWIYYAAQILFFGAEFTQVYANRYGSRVKPSEDAVAVTEEARAQQGMPRQADVKAAAEGRQPAPVRMASIPQQALQHRGGVGYAMAAGLFLVGILAGISMTRRI